MISWLKIYNLLLFLPTPVSFVALTRGAALWPRGKSWSLKN